MSVLKNKRRTSKIEYEKNFLGLYEYMMNLIDHIPKRWKRPLGVPMKEALNQMYDDVLMVSEMYIEKEQSKSKKKGVENMSFYKIIQDSTIIGVCTDNDFRRWQAKHNIIVVSDRDRVEAVDYNGTLYHDSWMADSGHILYETATVTEITEEEYNTIKEQLDDGEFPDDGSLVDEVTVEEPAPDPSETETVRKTTAQLLQEQIEAVARQTVGLAGAYESNFVASRNYVKGELIVIDNTMYSVTANIARGSRIVPYLNVTKTNLVKIMSTHS